MDFVNQARELFRQALGDAIRNHIPEGMRRPLVAALLLLGVSYIIVPQRFRRAAQNSRSPAAYTFLVRCTGIVMLVAAGVLLQFP